MDKCVRVFGLRGLGPAARVGVSDREAALEEQRASRARPAEPLPDAPFDGHTVDPA